MKLDEIALKHLVPYINECYYRTGPELVDLFNQYGSEDVYARGFPSRSDYTLSKLEDINNSKQLERFMNHIVYSRTYLGSDINIASDLIEPINEIIKYCGYALQRNEQDEFVVTGEGLIPEDIIEIQTSFENIQSEILEQLTQAKFTIWVSVAWFTDNTLFSILKKKASQGINIQLIINKDDINSQTGFDFENYFETYRKTGFGAFQDNIFHEKFCVIDLKTVINGSYNWTNKAMYNHENINIIHSYSTAETYASRFVRNKLL
ncbi:phospholipase D-like domain-containing protein [Guptibacillus hwajinpoensis]|uniref:phospholipase D-like domain-containing protein n=1 Tax=Guptibacillus hwajinpoensis TaxID=208199 RepID=UPI001CD2614E|nr:phospholipase D-like domain-containing protein [Pseudalkalibacillus hwajinpoensis]MCA0991686.1 phospholipase D-like domain-containing protein [Pseudalkalibacillus hwajinpoensis]